MAGSQPSSVAVNAFAARLVALAGVFGLAILTQLHGSLAYSERQLTALYGLVLVGFLLALAYGVVSAWGGRGPNYKVELSCDLVLIGALVHCTGGSGSPLGFLYIIWIIYAALAGGPGVSLLALGAASLAYASVGLAPVYGWLPPFEPNDVPTQSEAAPAFGVHLVAFLSAALMARQLAKQVQQGREELHELGEIHRRIVDNVSTGLLSVNRQGAITSFNREAERITGYACAEVLSRPLADVFPDLSGSGALEALEAAKSDPAERGLVSRIEVGFRNRQGERLRLGMSASILRDPGGQSDGAVVIFQDLTHVAEMEEQLRRSERLSGLGQLAAGLAHEVRNPLASLSGAIELLSADLPSDDPNSRRLTQIVSRETQRLNRLVSDFLSYAKPGPGRQESVELAPLFDELKELLASGEHASVELDLHVMPGLRVDGDPDQLRQVFWNLLRNAAEADSESARVEIRATAGEAGFVDVVVQDDGVGIPASDLERIFEPFYTTKAKGTGLGLATVHRMVEAHGGRLKVSSEPGKGTNVRVVLPRA